MTEKTNVTGKGVGNPASGVKDANDDWGDMIDAQIATVECISAEFPDAEARFLEDQWAYDIVLNGEVLGTVYYATELYLTGMSIVLNEKEICAQVKEIKKKWLGTQKATKKVQEK